MVPCNCSAYKFPHRAGSGKCQEHWDLPVLPEQQVSTKKYDEELFLFERNEVRALNSHV